MICDEVKMVIKVSVIIPVYNSEKYLYQCLESVTGQTLRDIEIILIDDGSTDSSYEICEKFQGQDNRIRLYRQENKGAGVARNYGIQLATGEYLLFLDSDDFFELDMLQSLYRRAKTTDADITFCDYWEFDDVIKQDKTVLWSARKDLIPKKKVFTTYECSNGIFQLCTGAVWTSLYKSSFILKNNLQFSLLKRTNDIFFCKAALAVAEKISWVEKKLLHYRINVQDTLTTSADEYPYTIFYAYEQLHDFLMQKNLYYFFEKSFLNKFISASFTNEIGRLSYPLRFFSEQYFVDKIIPKYQLKTLQKEYFYNQTLYNKIRECIQSNNRSQVLRKWYEEKKSKIVPIVLEVDKKATFTCDVMIRSIIEHTTNDYFYDIYVLCNDLPDYVTYEWENMTEKNVHVTAVSIKEDMPILCSTPTFYFSFLIPSLFSYDKILYLHSNSVVQSDISKLYDTELGDNLIAGVADVLNDQDEKSRIEWGLELLSYVNIGVLLINNKLWREEEIQKKCMEELMYPHHPYPFKDQDIINFICQDRVLLLDYKWNVLDEALQHKKDKYELCVENVDPSEYYIIHYDSNVKPWDLSENKLSNIWWRYARKIPSYEAVFFQCIKNKMQEKKQKKSPSGPPKQSKMILDPESLYQLKSTFVKKTLKYLFSFGEKKKMYRVELDMMLKKLKGA